MDNEEFDENVLTGDRWLDLFMDQNNKCNLRCIMCGFSDPRVRNIHKYDMPLWLFKKIADQVFRHVKYLALSCLTEPFMTLDFDSRLNILKNRPVPFTEIMTNGMLLTGHLTLSMIEVGINRIAISLDGATKALHEKVRTGSNFNKVLDNISMLKRLSARERSKLPELRVNHVLTEFNIHEFESFLNLVESLGASSIDVRTIIPINSAGYKGDSNKKFFSKVSHCKQMLLEWVSRTDIKDVGYLADQNEEIVLTDGVGEKLLCNRPWNSVAIHANGDVLPCISWNRGVVGNMASQSFKEIWKGASFKAARNFVRQQHQGLDCRHCVCRKSSVQNDADDYFFIMLNKFIPKI